MGLGFFHWQCAATPSDTEGGGVWPTFHPKQWVFILFYLWSFYSIIFIQQPAF